MKENEVKQSQDMNLFRIENVKSERATYSWRFFRPDPF
jgi:hypothetical protein